MFTVKMVNIKKFFIDFKFHSIMKIIIARHGETEHNRNKICQGHSESNLTEKGVEQAKKLALRLKNVNIDCVYSSDLSRAVETAKEILKFHPQIKLKLDKRIRERSFGRFEGKAFPEYAEWDNLKEDIETNESMCSRAKSFLQEIFRRHKESTVLVVSHGGIKKALLTIIHNKPNCSFNEWAKIKNTSVSEYDVYLDKNIFTEHYFNCTKHLGFDD